MTKIIQTGWDFDPQDSHFAFFGPEVRPAASNPDYDFRVEFSDHVPSEEQGTWASLIAAAPDLLVQLTHARVLLLDAYSVFGEHRLAGIDAAIAKAEGKTV